MFSSPVPYQLTFDDRVLLFVNHVPHTPLLDAFAVVLSGLGNAGFIWFFVAAWLFVREEHKNHRFFLPVVIAGGVSLLLVEYILKPLIARPRPFDYIGIIRVVTEPGSFSFPSAHATVAFTMAVVLSGNEPRWRPGLYLLAVLIAWSRIYLGVHYPSDVAAGALIGAAIGTGVQKLLQRSNGTRRKK